MDVLIKSSNGITQVSANAKLLSKRKVFVEGEITPEEACEFIKKIMILNEEDSIKPIDVLINSPGGDVNSGMVMYDVIQASKAPLRMPISQEIVFRRDQRPVITMKYEIQKNTLYRKITDDYKKRMLNEERSENSSM
ncbi:ClpP family protease [Agathobacter rectalis]|uniref:ATP-dependent Clp protease proteolytic subunit n=1 Tax=Agathobacter rectalis TaxID=39491 RepID=A0A395UUS2_9FIRM|nr:ATP-dependent Clp protease proteolytic subunit [Agathobacter rectalis]RGR52511.1 hypothetical protein DWY38_14230 [Agathobacter rectalis]